MMAGARLGSLSGNQKKEEKQPHQQKPGTLSCGLAYHLHKTLRGQTETLKICGTHPRAT